MVYQFSLAPLLLDAFLNEDAGPLTEWLASLGELPPGTTYLNFTASHDGIGVRSLEGLLPAERIARLVDAVRARGGLVSERRKPDGSDAPYELNITYFDALRPADDPSHESKARALLASQAIMLALRGVPGVYFHSLVGTPNDHASVAATGRSRSINRRKFQLDELQRIVTTPGASQSLVFEQYRRMLATRIAQPAFHPQAAQVVYRFSNPAILGFLRTIVEQLKGATYIDQIVVVLGIAPQLSDYQQARNLIAPLGDKAQVLWTDGPRLRELYENLCDTGFNVSTPGKGRSVWTAFGYLLADPRLQAFVLSSARWPAWACRSSPVTS
jgi:hypothetical protein